MDLHYLRLVHERDIIEREIYKVEVLVTDHFKMAKHT